MKNTSTPYGFNMTMERFVYLGRRHLSSSCWESENWNPPSSCQSRARTSGGCASPLRAPLGPAARRPGLFSDCPLGGRLSSRGTQAAGRGGAPSAVSATARPRARSPHASVLDLVKRPPGVPSPLGEGLRASGLRGSPRGLMRGQR